MKKLKICMIGSYSVGKTSLVERYVQSIYSDDYHTTIGVKIEKKIVTVDETEALCMIWDIAGEDEFYTINNSYLRGMSGYFLVVDGTRPVTLEVAKKIHARIELIYPETPFVLIANKSDLVMQWALSDEDIDDFSTTPYTYIKTSAKENDHVDQAFEYLVRKLLTAKVG